MTERRLVLFGPNGSEVTHDSLRKHAVGFMDLSDMPNADSRAPLHVAVQEKCNMGHWHIVGGVNLPPWDDQREPGA